MVSPHLVGEVDEPTFVGSELQFDLDELTKSFEKECGGDITPNCKGVWDYGIESRVLGCKGYAERYHFLIPWIEMKKRGIPKMLRTHPKVLAPMCTHCYLLYDSKHRRLKTAWVKEAGLEVHKSPAYMRKHYDKSYSSLIKINQDIIREATTLLDEQFLACAIITEFQLGIGNVVILEDQDIITNIDTTSLRQEGKIIITTWNQLEFYGEAPM
jgi:hypothetical protein